MSRKLGQRINHQGGGGGLGDLMNMVSKNPQILQALASLLSSRDTSVGGSGGLDTSGFYWGYVTSRQAG